MLLMDINYTEIPNFVILSISMVLLLSILFGLVMQNYWVTPLLTLIILALSAFVLPNYYSITYPPLLGYAVFMTLIAIVLNILCWYLNKGRRSRRRLRDARTQVSSNLENAVDDSETGTHRKFDDTIISNRNTPKNREKL